MKTIQLLTLVFFSIICSYSYAQNLQFNSAIYNEYGGGLSNGNSVFDIVTSGTLTVGLNQVLKVTSIGGNITGSTGIQATYATINEKVVSFNNLGNELYLPTGIYIIGFTDFPSYAGEVKGYISDVLYDIVP